MSQPVLIVEDYNGLTLESEQIEERILHFKTLIKDDADIDPNMRQDDKFLLRYLHFSDFNIESAFLRYKKFYKLLQDYAKWFGFASPKAHEKQLIKKMRILLDTRDREGRLILIGKIGNMNTSESTLRDVFNVDDIMFELSSDDPVTLRKGLCTIVDVKDLSLKLMAWSTPANLIFSVKKLDAIPIKDLKVHLVNRSRYLDAFLAMTWPFMPSKLKENIFIHHDDWESLHKHIDPSSLPLEFGGTNSKTYDEYINDVLDRDEELIEATKYIKLVVKDKDN